jgi:hypothetical protein
MPDEDASRRAWSWVRLHGALPAEATYLSRVHPEVDPRRVADTDVAHDLLARHREDNRPR